MAKIVLIMEQLHTKNSKRFSGKDDPDYYVSGGSDPVPTPPEESNKPSKRSFWVILVNVLLAIWQAPQNLVGLLVACFTGWGYQGIIGGVMFFTKNGTGCVSLGQFVFVTRNGFMYKPSLCAHEWGHARQSRMLGWLYLFVIGIPSAIKCATTSDSESYHNFYTEKWADRLGERFPEDECKDLRDSKI